MSVLKALAEEEFNTQREQWENILKAELRSTDIGHKGSKTSIDGGVWPTLSISTKSPLHLGNNQSWKKAAQTYARINPSTIEKELLDDLDHGVRNFFFHKKFLNESNWTLINKLFSAQSYAKEIDVILLGPEALKISKTPFKLIDESGIFTGRPVYEGGGTHFLELALLTCELIEKLKNNESVINIGVFTDSQFFRNIAKIRAAKLLALKVLQEHKSKALVSVTALSSYREWTLYERYSNILRNDSAVASSLIAGADHVQSSGYNILFDYGVESIDEHDTRSKRMARNTSHILALESLLGVVEDPAFGSYHLEGMSQQYAEEAWKQMQTLLPLSLIEREARIKEECIKTWEKRLILLKTRKHVMAGINDFPDAREKLGLASLPVTKEFRLAKDFENLRLKTELKPVKEDVFIGIFGDYATLNARLNFVKNYFQMLGLDVHEVRDTHQLEKVKGIVVLCAQDDEYPELMQLKLQSKLKYIAGKFPMPGFVNLFAGQDVYSILEGIQ